MLFLKIILIISIFLILIITVKVEVKIQNIKYNSEKVKGERLANNYQIIIKILTLEKIPIFRLKINNSKIEKINAKTHLKQKIKEEIQKQDIAKAIEMEKKYDLKKLILEVYKNIKLETENINLKIDIGTENVVLTSFIIPIISTILAFTVKRNFEVQPIYQNKNIIKFELNGIFSVKMIHIIDTICILKKKRRVYKNERTSNRRTYDNCYE